MTVTAPKRHENLYRIHLRENSSQEGKCHQEEMKEEDNFISRSLSEEFSHNGFIAIPNILSQDDVDALNDRLEMILRGEYDRDQKPDKAPKLIKSDYHTGQFSTTEKAVEETKNAQNYFSNAKHERPRGAAAGPLGFSGNFQNVKVLQVINVHKADTLFRKFATSSTLGKLVSGLANWKYGARLAQDQVWAKPPGAPPLTFHRDSPYFMFDPPSVVTVWVALDTMDHELGPLEYVKGSHKWSNGRVGSASQFFQPNGGLKLVRSAAEKMGIPFDQLDIVSMAGLEAGGISIHDGRTWHGSGRNSSRERPRRGLGLHFVPAEVSFTSNASNSKLWRSYVQDVVDAATAEVPEEDFPIVWRPVDNDC